MRTTKKEAFSEYTPQDFKDFKVRKIENNTWERRGVMEGITIIRLHRTDIITKFPNGQIKLDSGGWQSVTTKERMSARHLNERYTVGQVKGQWYVRDMRLNRKVPFYDGILLPDAFETQDQGIAA